jgi:hypothetical protein
MFSPEVFVVVASGVAFRRFAPKGIKVFCFFSSEKKILPFSGPI